MTKLEISREHRALIESVIRENPRFKGNENLIDAFCSAIYKKSYLIIDTIRDMSRLRRHLSMVSDSCMDQIIREKRKADDINLYNQIIKKAYQTHDIVSLKNSSSQETKKREKSKYKTKETEIINLKEEIQVSEKYGSSDDLADPLEYCPQKKVNENAIEKLAQIIKIIDEKYPQKKFYEIFSLRYIKRFNQTEIARNLRISQVELSKRFVELVSLTKEYA